MSRLGNIYRKPNATRVLESGERVQLFVNGGQIGGAVGATIGQTLIPIPGVGAGIGKIGGELIGDTVQNLFGRGKRRREARRMEELNKVNNAVGVDMGIPQFGNGGKLTTKYADGGLLRDSNLQPISKDGNATAIINGKAVTVPIKGKRKRLASGGRLSRIAKTNALKVEGPSHEGGGVQLPQYNAEVEGGETIDMVGGSPHVFSDRLKVPGTNKSFADVHEAGKRRGVGQKFVNDLAESQANENVQLGDGERFLQTGKGLKFRRGGDLLSGLVLGAPIQNSTNTNRQRNQLAGTLNIDGSSIRNAPGLPPVSAASDVTPVTESDKSGFFSNNADLIAPLTNIAAGVLGTNRGANISPTKVDRGSVRRLSSLPTRFNINPQLAEQRRSFATLNRNPNVSQNALLAARSQNLQNRTRLLSEKENRENQLLANRTTAIANATARLDLADAGSQQQANLFNAQEAANARANNINLLTTGIGQVGNVLNQRNADRRALEAEPLQLAALLAGSDKATSQRLLRMLASVDPDRFTKVMEAMNGN